MPTPAHLIEDGIQKPAGFSQAGRCSGIRPGWESAVGGLGNPKLLRLLTLRLASAATPPPRTRRACRDCQKGSGPWGTEWGPDPDRRPCAGSRSLHCGDRHRVTNPRHTSAPPGNSPQPGRSRVREEPTHIVDAGEIGEFPTLQPEAVEGDGPVVAHRAESGRARWRHSGASAPPQPWVSNCCTAGGHKRGCFATATESTALIAHFAALASRDLITVQAIHPSSNPIVRRCRLRAWPSSAKAAGARHHCLERGHGHAQ